jgi:hypothetical protein
MKNLKRVALLPLLFLLAFASISYALNTSKLIATVTILPAKLVITIISPKNISYDKNCVPLTFTINKPTSWIKYSLDNKANVTITRNITLTGLSEGAHSIIVFAKDKSGNEAKSNIVYFTIVKGLLGSVDIGKMNNEVANLLGWSKPQPKTSGGTWGGVTDKTYWRTVSCTNCREGDSAYAFVFAGENPQTIRIEHLDGLANDSFDVYVLDLFKWVKIGSYKDQFSGSEHIVTTDFNMTNIHTFGFVEVKITLTGKHWSDYKTYGQLAIHKIDVLGLSGCDNEHDNEHDDKH